MQIIDILTELNKSNSSLYKQEVLKKHKDNELLKRVLELTYDNVRYTFGVTLKSVLKYTPNEDLLEIDLNTATKLLKEDVNVNGFTGNSALQACINLITSLNTGDSEILKRIINRDIKCNIGRTIINKVWPKLISKQIYMRCDVYGIKTKDKIKLPAYIQLKADGTYRELQVCSSIKVRFKSRSGEEYRYTQLEKQCTELPLGYYTGELTIACDEEIIKTITEKLENAIKKGEPTELLLSVINEYENAQSEYILPRSLGNGIINSDNVPSNQLRFDVWDYITVDDYNKAANLKEVKLVCSETLKQAPKELKKKTREQNKLNILNESPNIPYKQRFEKLSEIIFRQ